MVTPGFSARRAKFFQRYPAAEKTEAALKGEANPEPLFFFHECQDPDLKGCWVALGRLGTDLEKQFDIAGEVLFLFTPHEDLQRRTFNALVGRLRQEVDEKQKEAFGHVRFTPDPSLAMLWAPDPQAQSHLESWNLQSRGAVVALIPKSSVSVEEHRAGMRRAVRRVLASRDLYTGRNPVTGNNFFGRQELLQSLKASVLAGQSVGLFGLRRSGKTSVLKEFARRYSRDIAVLQLDLEALTDIADAPPALGRSIVDALRELKKSNASIWLGSEAEHVTPDFMGLSDRLVRVAQKNSDLNFVVAIDELESLVPHLEESPDEMRRFFGSLRGAAQKADNLSLLLTGVTTRFFEQSMLSANSENPLFGFVDEVYLRPFIPVETSQLVKKLGRPMGLVWSEEALVRLHQAAGGFPFFVRDIASAVRTGVLSRADLDDLEFQVEEADVDDALEGWAESAAKLWSEIVRTLSHHHDIMGEVVACEADVDINDWSRAGEDGLAAARSLERLGLLTQIGGQYRRSDTLLALQALSAGTRETPDELRRRRRERDDHSARFRRLVNSPEGVQLELKSSVRWDYSTCCVNKDLIKPIVKTIAAFLNTQGGTLLIGVRDDGHPVGIQKDLESLSNSEDRFERHVLQALINSVGQALVSPYVTLSFADIEDHRVCAVDVKPCPEAVWVDDGGHDTFYVRTGNQSHAIRPREVEDWLARRRST